jgi:hypothetical protein
VTVTHAFALRLPFAACLLVAVPAAPACGASSVPLPNGIAAEIQHEYGSARTETRYFAGAFDLDGDGKPEIVVFVLGEDACGTGGCPTLVYTPEGSAYRRVTTVLLTRPPVRAATTASHGWRDLVVHIAGGGAHPADVALSFDGRRYPANPTVSGRVLPAAALASSQVIIPEFTSPADAALLAPPR